MAAVHLYTVFFLPCVSFYLNAINIMRHTVFCIMYSIHNMFSCLLQYAFLINTGRALYAFIAYYLLMFVFSSDSQVFFVPYRFPSLYSHSSSNMASQNTVSHIHGLFFVALTCRAQGSFTYPQVARPLHPPLRH